MTQESPDISGKQAKEVAGILLSIETSCDDTSVAVIRDGALASLLVSSQEIHAEWGGIVPEMASRAHLRTIEPLLEQALARAGVEISEVDAVAATNRPGLIGSLLVGLNVAKGLAVGLSVPFLAVNHIEAHLLSVMLEGRVEFPYLALLVSGGHTMLYDVRAEGDYELLGATLDDAAGEAFDKGAKLMGLGYPGGPEIDERARHGSSDAVDFPRSMIDDPGYTFSFSGLKTALRYHLEREFAEREPSERDLADLSASYQEAIIEPLLVKSFRAADQLQRDRIALVGGVAANSRLRALFEQKGSESGRTIYTTRPLYSTDNAAMIGVAAWHRFVRGESDPLTTVAESSLPEAKAFRRTRGKNA